MYSDSIALREQVDPILMKENTKMIDSRFDNKQKRSSLVNINKIQKDIISDNLKKMIDKEFLPYTNELGGFPVLDESEEYSKGHDKLYYDILKKANQYNRVYYDRPLNKDISLEKQTNINLDILA